MVSGIIGNDVPRKGLRVRSPCPPLRPLAVGRFRLAMCRLLTDRPDIVFLDARTQRSGTQCNGTRTRGPFELQRYRSLIEAVRGNLRTNRSDCNTGSIRVRVPIGYKSLGAELSEALARRISIARTNWGS